MNYNKKDDRFEKNTKPFKRANSSRNFLKTSPRANKIDVNTQSEMIHLSLVIDEENKISTDIYSNQDISEFCEKIAEKFKLNEKIKVKLHNRIQNQIQESSNNPGTVETSNKVESLVKRLYNESVEKRKKFMIQNEKLKISKEEKELESLKFSPSPSTFNISNNKRKYEKIEDKIYYDHKFKKNRVEVNRVLKGIGNYVQSKQYVYRENILKKNLNEEEESQRNKLRRSSSDINIKKMRNSEKSESKENSALLPKHEMLKSKSGQGQKRNKNQSELKEDFSDSGKADQSSHEVELHVNNNKEMPLKGFLRSGNITSEEKFLAKNRKKLKEYTLSNQNSKIITNNINISNQTQQDQINLAGINPNYINANQALNKVEEFNLHIPDEQQVNLNKNKSFYSDMYRKIHNSNSSLSNFSINNNIPVLKARVLNNNLTIPVSKSSPIIEEGKNSTVTKIIETTFNNLHNDDRKKSINENLINQISSTPSVQRDMEQLYSSKQNNLSHLSLIKQNNIAHSENSKTSLTKEDRSNLAKTQINLGKIKEEKQTRDHRHFSFKDFNDLSGNFGRNIREEISKNENREKLKNKSEIDIANKSLVSDNQIPVRSKIKSNANLNKTHGFMASDVKSSVSLINLKHAKTFPKNEKLVKKLENIHDRLYKSYEDIKKKKEDHIKNVIRNTCPFKPNLNHERPKSVDLNSKFFPSRNTNQNIFDRLHNSDKTQKITRSILTSPTLASDRLANTNFKTERSKKIFSSKSASNLSTRNFTNSRQRLREKKSETELYDTFLKNNISKEKLKFDAQKKSNDILNNFKLKNLKEIFQIIYNNCKSVEDFQNIEKFGISKLIKENLIIPTSFLIKERNLEFNFGNFYLIANELMKNII